MWPRHVGIVALTVVLSFWRGAEHTRDETAELRLHCGPRDLVEHLSELPAYGMHVLAARQPDVSPSASAMLTLDVYVDGVAVGDGITPETIELGVGCEHSACGHADSVAWVVPAIHAMARQQRPRIFNQLRRAPPAIAEAAALEQYLEDAQRRIGPPVEWGFFTPRGFPIKTAREFLQAMSVCGTVYAFEGGNWIWPGIRVGHNVTIPAGGQVVGDVTLTTLSLIPPVFVVDGLLNKEISNEIIAASGTRVVMSKSPGRTSAQSDLNHGGALVEKIRREAHRVMNTPLSHGEPLQLVRYQPRQQYDYHTDCFDPDMYSYVQQQDDLDWQHIMERNRFATLLWYLSSSPAGGATHFPRANLSPQHEPHPDCANSSGVKVQPRAGQVLLFYSLRPDGAADPYSLHAGCPAVETKWIVAQGVWTRPWDRSIADKDARERGILYRRAAANASSSSPRLAS